MVYIGKTSYFMDICWKLHVKSYNNSCESKKTSKLYNFIRDNGGIHEFTYLILEEIHNISKFDINVLHNSYIDQFDALNKLNSSKNSLIPFSKNDPDSIKLYKKTTMRIIDLGLNAILPKKLLVTFVVDLFKSLIFLTILPVLSVFGQHLIPHLIPSLISLNFFYIV